MTNTADLVACIEPVVRRLGFVLVRVRLSGVQDLVLQVMAERPHDGQLDIEECAALSRALSDMLDTTDPIAGAYRLEVSSPGVDRPLTRLDDFHRWQGFTARITLSAPVAERKRLQGLLRGVVEDCVHIEDGTAGLVSVPFASIQSAKLVLTDALLAATKPNSVDIGPDRIVRPVAESLN